MSESESIDLLDAGVHPEDAAAVEFMVRCRLSSPLKSWFKSNQLVEASQVKTAIRSGVCLESIAQAGLEGFDVDVRPGSARRSYGFLRVAEEREPRSWWIEGGSKK